MTFFVVLCNKNVFYNIFPLENLLIIDPVVYGEPTKKDHFELNNFPTYLVHILMLALRLKISD